VAQSMAGVPSRWCSSERSCWAVLVLVTHVHDGFSHLTLTHTEARTHTCMHPSPSIHAHTQLPARHTALVAALEAAAVACSARHLSLVTWAVETAATYGVLLGAATLQERWLVARKAAGGVAGG
jgi:hypothetical protein